MKIVLFALAAFLVSVTVATETESQEVQGAPWFCHGLDCPAYKVLNSTDKYEIRRVKGGKWAATKVESLLYSVGITEGFQKLFNYISGENEDKEKVEMTAPVVTRIVPGDGPFCKSTFSVHFFVPFDHQDHPPKPSNPDVHIEKAGTEVFAVSQFGGFLVDDFTLSSKAKSLQKALEDDEISFESDSYFTAGYDPPTRLQHRHNEIWVRLTSAEDKISLEQPLTS